MGNLRIKLKYKSFEIELEGDKDTVQSEFKEIKENGLGNIVMGVDFSEQKFLVNSDEKENSAHVRQLQTPETVDFVETSKLPSIKDVIMKQLPSSETEWIIVYAFYASNYGEKTFTGKDILSMYESTKRNTSSRKRNLSNNLKSLFTKGYLSALNDDDYILTDDGKRQANEIVSRTHSTPNKQAKSKTTIDSSQNKQRKSTNSKVPEVLKDLNLRPADKISLPDYMEKFDAPKNPDKIIVVINYLKEILNIDKVTLNHIYTAFWVLKFRVPKNFNQLLIDTRGRNKVIEYDNTDDINLSVLGSNRIRFDINKE